MPIRSSCLAVGVVLLAGVHADAAKPVELRFDAGPQSRIGSVVRFRLPESVSDRQGIELLDTASEIRVAVQRIPGTEEAVFILHAPLEAGASRTYRLLTGRKQENRATCVEGDGRLTPHVRGKPVLAYNTRIVEPPEPFDPLYRRSGHLHPVLTPAGRVVTDEFPVDHPHQHGIFAAWVRTRFEGRSVDFWNQKAGTGTVEHRETVEVIEGPVFSSFTVRLAYVTLSETEGKRDVLHEWWTLRTYAVEEGRLFEIESVQQCVADSPLVLEEYHYGGMAIRGSGEWRNQPEHDFLTSEGKTRRDGNHTRPHWVSMHGPVEGAMCGITAFAHPENFRSPQPVRLHPSMPYFVFSPPVLGEFEIPPGEKLISKYRFHVYDGEPDADRFERLWKDYADPIRMQ